MSKLGKLFTAMVGRTVEDEQPTSGPQWGAGVMVYDATKTGLATLGDAAIKGNEVVIFNPAIILDRDGNTPDGVSAQMVSEFLAASVSSFAEQDLGPMTVKWTRREGRFCMAEITVKSWGEKVNLVQPIGSISIELADVWKTYSGAMALKIKEAHKEQQNFTAANALLRTSLRKLEALRNHPQMQFSRAEYLYLSTVVQRAMVQSVVVGEHDHQPEPIMDEPESFME